jgi:hypothetical protein
MNTLTVAEMAVWAPDEPVAEPEPAIAEPEWQLVRLDRQGLWLSGTVAVLALLAGAALASWSA